MTLGVTFREREINIDYVEKNKVGMCKDLQILSRSLTLPLKSYSVLEDFSKTGRKG